MTSREKVQTENQYISLHETVIIGYADIAAAGCDGNFPYYSFVRKVFIVSALRLDLLEGPIKRMYENVWNGMAPTTNCKSLPRDLKFVDSFLSNLIQIFLIEGIPFSLLISPANKAELGQAGESDGTKEVITVMHEYLNDVTHLGFSLDDSCSVIYKGDSASIDDQAAMIYV